MVTLETLFIKLPHIIPTDSVEDGYEVVDDWGIFSNSRSL